MSEKKPKKEQSPRCTKAEMEARIEIVMNHLMMGRSKSYIVRFSCNTWGIGERQVDELIARATAEMAELNALTRKESLEQIIANYWMLYRQAMAKKDHYLALSVAKEIAKVKGLNEQHVIHTIRDKDLEEVDDDTLSRELEEQARSIQ